MRKPASYSKWNGRLLAECLPDVSKDQVWRILRRHDICLQRRRSWCISTDAEFGPKAADVVGLYLNPPDNALVLSVDEKPSIQPLERAQGHVDVPGYLRLPNGKAVRWFSILSRQALQGASFTSPAQLRQAIDDFVKVYNTQAAPFEWKKAVVFPSSPTKKYADLCN